MRLEHLFAAPLLERYDDVVTALQRYSADPSIYISFTELPKIGINPGYQYDTPAGIYAYPLAAAWDQVAGRGLPFASDRTYVHVLKATGNIMELSEYNEAALARDFKRLNAAYNYLLAPTPPPNDADLTELFTTACEKWKRTAKPGDYAASGFWNITRNIGMLLAKQRGGVRAHAAWNAVLRSLGYDGVSDKTGLGIIHGNEPIQAVFLSSKAFQQVRMLHNVNKLNEPVHEIFELSDLTALLTARRDKSNANALRLGALVITEFPDILSKGQSAHFDIGGWKFWKTMSEQWPAFVQTILARDFRVFPKLVDIVAHHPELETKADVDALLFVQPRSLEKAVIYAESILGKVSRNFLFDIGERAATTLDTEEKNSAIDSTIKDTVRQAVSAVLRFLPKNPDPSKTIDTLRDLLKSVWLRVMMFLNDAELRELVSSR